MEADLAAATKKAQENEDLIRAHQLVEELTAQKDDLLVQHGEMHDELEETAAKAQELEEQLAKQVDAPELQRQRSSIYTTQIDQLKHKVAEAETAQKLAEDARTKMTDERDDLRADLDSAKKNLDKNKERYKELCEKKKALELTVKEKDMNIRELQKAAVAAADAGSSGSTKEDVAHKSFAERRTEKKAAEEAAKKSKRGTSSKGLRGAKPKTKRVRPKRNPKRYETKAER